MFIKIFSLFLCSFYLSLNCNGGEVLVDRMVVDPEMSGYSTRSSAVLSDFGDPDATQLGAGRSTRSSGGPVTPPPKRSRSEDTQDEVAESSFDESPHAKKSRISPKTGPSPHCQSERSQGCEDPRVLKSSLEYSYSRTITTTNCDAWHDRSLKILNDLIRQNSGFFKRKNAALLGVQFIYEHEGRLHLSKEFDFDIIFVSGGKPVDEKLSLRARSAADRTFEAKTVHDFLITDESSPRVTRQMRDTVMGYYSEAVATKLSASAVAARQKEASFPYFSPSAPRKPKKSQVHANSSFEIAYLHSEQAMLLMLVRQTAILTSFLEQLPTGATVHQATFLMASKNQMCRRCGACYFVAGGPSGILKTTLENYIRNFPEKGFKITSNGLNVFAQVSASKVFDNVNIDHRLRQLMHADAPITDSRLFAPHVAQRCLSKQLTRKQRNELERQKKSGVTKSKLFDDSDDD